MLGFDLVGQARQQPQARSGGAVFRRAIKTARLCIWLRAFAQRDS
jgi:hypothetical protein